MKIPEDMIPPVVLKYSSISGYLDEVWKEAKQEKITFKKISGDFWAYNNIKNNSHPKYSFWTGYFSTNPDFKSLVVDFSDFTHSYQLLTSFSSPFK